VTRRILVALAVVAGVLLPGAPAWAHNQLAGSAPASGATLPAAPATVTLRFTEALNPEFTTIAVSDGARRRVPTSAPVVDGTSGTVTVDGAMANGVYTVAFRTVSVDGHTVQGSYTFMLADPAKPAVTAAAVAPPTGGGTSIAVPIGAGVLLTFAGCAAFLFRRSRRSPGRPLP
jgi:methionine-rich copper-binding protein CopC